MGIERVRHRRDHDAGDEDHHAERHCAAVAGHLGAAGGRRQLNLVDMRDPRCHDDALVLPGLVSAQLLSRDRCRHPHGTPGDPDTSFVVEVVRHGDFTGEEEVGHLGCDVSQSLNSYLKTGT